MAGRVALVTGGATGIGRATVLRLAAAGVGGLVVNYHTDAQAADEVAAEARRHGAETVCVQADVRDDAQVRDMLRQVGERFGRLDVLVNNAGITHWVPIADLDGLTDAIWRDVLDVDLVAAFRCVRAAAPLLEAAAGCVVNVASVSGMLAGPTVSSLAYGAAKAGLIYLTRGLAVALAPRVRVNAVAPGFVDTRWMQRHFGEDYPAAVARAASSIPLGRVATAEDVADAILSLADGSRFVTGQTLVVDGGLSLA
jgi:NAD(P)-dependent dehydrogenase (short-subunit alcohol dehydrogenase family)